MSQFKNPFLKRLSEGSDAEAAEFFLKMVKNEMATMEMQQDAKS